jgi:hypothetical protein
VDGDLGLTNGSSSFRTNGFAHVVINPKNGNIYVAYNDVGQSAKDKADVYFTQSTDGGKTWSAARRVNDDTTTNDQWAPAIAVTPDGTHLFIGWYDRRQDPNNKHINWYGVTASISGSTITWGSNFVITNQWFPVAINQDPVMAQGYMGDYDQAVATNQYFLTTWGDNSSSDKFHNHQPDVLFSAIAVNTSGAPAPFKSNQDNSALAGALGGVAFNPLFHDGPMLDVRAALPRYDMPVVLNGSYGSIQALLDQYWQAAFE